MAWVVLREKISLLEILGILFSFAGVVMIGFSKQQRIDDKNDDIILEDTIINDTAVDDAVVEEDESYR
jgi:hypothetical protein